jgi:uncharacterized protein YndB with AHSA1/START domain
MKTLHFTTLIQAPRQVVWNTMLERQTYEIWTTEFTEGSTFEGSWNQGERIRFLAPGGSGITSVIEENRPLEFISIKHLGEIKNGVEDTDSAQVRSWAPSYEKYTFSDAGGVTQITVAVDVIPEFEDYMVTTWPKAFAKLKALCESRSG